MNSPRNLPNQVRVRRSCSVINFSLRTAAVVATATALATPASLFGFWEVARGELILNTTLAGSYDSNVFASKDANSDFLFSLTPELQFLRQAGRGTIDLRAGIDITRYIDYSSEDFEDFFANLELTYPVSPQSPLSGGFTAAYTERSGVNDYLSTRVDETFKSVGLNTNYQFSERTEFRNRLGYSKSETKSFSDVEAYSGTLGLAWKYSSALSYFTDYRLRKATSSRTGMFQNVENIDHALFVGAEGTLLPRLLGNVSIGYQHSNARGAGSNADMAVAAAGLEWLFRPATSFNLTLVRDLDVSPENETVEETGISVGVNHRIEPKIDLTSFIGYRDLKYRGSSHRNDGVIKAGAGMIYTFTRHWDGGIDYFFTYNDSNQNYRDYRRHLVRLYTRYSF